MAACLFFTITCLHAQQTWQYNLPQLLQQNKLLTTPEQQTQALDAPGKEAISTQGIVWLKDVRFTEGTIDVDLRGKNVFLQSFLGIAFHGEDSTSYETVYFRPFNFRHADTSRRKWSVQYMMIPAYDYSVLRKAHPLVYENAVNPVPQPDDWFHATIRVKGDWITVFVNHSATASLQVKKLGSSNTGKIGLWTSGLSGDFAHLSITQ